MPEKVSSSPPPTFEPPPTWYLEKAGIDATCALLPCQQALGAAKLVMPDDGLAESMVDHFRLGESAAVEVDLNAELARNPQLAEYVGSRIENDLAQRAEDGSFSGAANGAVWVPQSGYGSSEAGDDQRLALGGTYFEYEVVATADTGDLEVRLDVSDHYFFTPSDATRTTQCLHECASRMVADGEATEFYQYGEGSLIVGDPRSVTPMPLLAGEPLEQR